MLEAVDRELLGVRVGDELEVDQAGDRERPPRVIALQQIEVGHRGRLGVEVASGRAEGTEVVVHPSDRIRDGAKLARAR